MLIDGLSRKEVEWNIYAFGADMKRFARKRDAARKDHTRAHWQKKYDDAKYYLENNQKRLARFEAVEQCMQPTSPMPPENFEVRAVTWDEIEKDFEEGASG